MVKSYLVSKREEVLNVLLSLIIAFIAKSDKYTNQLIEEEL